MKKQNIPQPLSVLAVTIAAISSIGSVQAAQIETGNPNLVVRWDNTVRYNLGVRTEKQDKRLLANSIFDDGDGKFDKGDIITNRLDILSELDVDYDQRFGFRLTAALWYDNAYNNDSLPEGTDSPYRSGRYSNQVSRFINGPSGEILDAFVWSNFEIGDALVNVKLGKHSILWGEGLFLGMHSISYSQAPVDGVKAVSSPGIEIKEVFLPINQLSFKAQVSDNLTLMGQYALEWKPFRTPYPGTYLMGADFAPGADQYNFAPGVNASVLKPREPKEGKNWGLGLKWNADAIDSDIGFYYREFDDVIPESGVLLSFTDQANPFTYSFQSPYADDVSIYGLSLGTSIGPVSVGSELSYRKNGHLNSSTSYVTALGYDTGARGNTWHTVVNGVYLLPNTSFWDTGSFVAEIGYSRLDKITKNKELYRGEGYDACVNANEDASDGCSTDDFFQIAFKFTPEYLQIIPGWDLKLPISLNAGISGNAASGSAGNEDAVSWSVAAAGLYLNEYEFTLRYADRSADTKYVNDVAVGGNGSKSTLGVTDRGYLNFTFKVAF
ncbi:MAG: hypothetical protein COA59_12520 [Colwellia sp.]|nr:MAG: hypothetical protein COA59_12520 [Colwellia sp.]